MAYDLAATILLDGIATARKGFTEFESRKLEDGTVRAFQQGTGKLVAPQEIEKLATSKRRPIGIPILTKVNTTTATVRSLDPTPDRAKSAKPTISWFDLAFSLEVTPTGNADNYIAEAQEFNHLLKEEIYGAVLQNNNSLEKNMVDFLEAHKWATPPASKVPGVTVGTGAYEVDNKDYIINAPVVMRERNINTSSLIDIGNVAAVSRDRKEAMYASNNQYNIDQYRKEMASYYSNRIGVDAGYVETHYVMPDNSIGVLNWIEYDARVGNKSHDGYYMQVVDPYFGFNWGVFVKASRSDKSADLGSGTERAVSYRYDFAATFGLISAFSSVVGESPIVKFNTTLV